MSNDDLVLGVSNEIEVEVEAMIPTGKRNGWRRIKFWAFFKPKSQDELEESRQTVAEALKECFKRVDFGTLKLAAEDEHGNPLEPRDIAMRNVFTYNALIREFRAQVLTKNVEGKR